MGYELMKVHRIKTHDGDTRQHIEGPQGSDDALCGITLDSDPMVIESHVVKEGKITCEACLNIIHFCKTLKEK